MRNWFAPSLLVALTLTSCLHLKQDFEDAQQTKNAIKNELNVDSDVRCNELSGIGGAKLFVSVRLSQPPPEDGVQFKNRVTDIVNRNFRSHVDRVTIDY